MALGVWWMLWVCVQVLSVCVREWGAVTCRTPLFIRVDRSRLEAALFVFFFLIPTSGPHSTACFYGESALLTKLSGSCRWLISVRRAWDLFCVWLKRLRMGAKPMWP